MKLIGYTCTYNEEDLVPYVMPYVEALCYDKFIVYDNNSTDHTVELLEKYPFVEIRKYDTNGSFNPGIRRQLEENAFLECVDMTDGGKELVWMTWTDFDEVLFFNTDCDFRPIFEGDYYNRGYNCFFKNMVNLFLPEDKKDESLATLMEGKRFVHSIPGVRANVWVGGMKPTMIAVNDFMGIKFVDGNHYAFARTTNGRPVKSYDDCCRMYAFHLKFIDREALLKKWKGYSERGGVGGKETYEHLLQRFNELYESQYSMSFPLSEYFLQDYFNSGLHNKSIPFNGITEI